MDEDFINYIRNSIDQTLQTTDNAESRVNSLRQVLDSIPTDNDAVSSLLPSFFEISSHLFSMYKEALLDWIGSALPKFSNVTIQPGTLVHMWIK
jgi:hypothetical protein